MSISLLLVAPRIIRFLTNDYLRHAEEKWERKYEAAKSQAKST